MRATTSFNKMLDLPALTVTDVTVGTDTVVLDVRHTRQLLRCMTTWKGSQQIVAFVALRVAAG